MTNNIPSNNSLSILLHVVCKTAAGLWNNVDTKNIIFIACYFYCICITTYSSSLVYLCGHDGHIKMYLYFIDLDINIHETN